MLSALIFIVNCAHCSRICEKSGQLKKLNDFKSDSDQIIPSCGELPTLDSIAEFCQDSASVPREFELSSKWSCDGTGPVVNDTGLVVSDTLNIICTDTRLSV